MSSFKPPRRVSVVVPTCDRPAMLRQALASIRALEGPDISFEILVGDNGQDAETRTVAEEYGAVYIPVSAKGAGAARNAGLKAASGEFIAFLDDDDVWLPTHLKPHMEILDTQPDVEAVIGQVIYTDHKLSPLGGPFPENVPNGGDDLLRRMLSGFFPQIGTLIVRTNVRSKIGLFDETLLGGQDLDWMLRFARRRTLGFVVIPCVLFRGRVNGTYDALQLRRINFDRKVFLRHAIAEWRLWRSPFAFEKAYRGTLSHFFQYFTEAALSRAKNGDRWGTLRACCGAFRVFPLRAAAHVVAQKPLGQAAIIALSSRHMITASSSLPNEES